MVLRGTGARTWRTCEGVDARCLGWQHLIPTQDSLRRWHAQIAVWLRCGCSTRRSAGCLSSIHTQTSKGLHEMWCRSLWCRCLRSSSTASSLRRRAAVAALPTLPALPQLQPAHLLLLLLTRVRAVCTLCAGLQQPMQACRHSLCATHTSLCVATQPLCATHLQLLLLLGR